MNQQSLTTAATLATLAAATLSQTKATPVDAGQAAQILLSTLEAAGPLVSPNVALAASMGSLALSMFHAASQGGQGISADAVKAAFDQAWADGLAAEAEARAAQPAPGSPLTTGA